MADTDINILFPRHIISGELWGAMRPEVNEWLKNNVNAIGGSWRWFSAENQNDVKMVGFSFNNVKNTIRQDFAVAFGGDLKYPEKESLFKKKQKHI